EFLALGLGPSIDQNEVRVSISSSGMKTHNPPLGFINTSDLPKISE
ncbi:13351_t:CDS:1, partial [Funneliformis geosporum]